MDITIRGKKRKPDVRFLDDRITCDGVDYLYSDILKIWTQKFLGASVDITYRGRHHAFKIDDGEMERAQKAVEEAQARITASFMESASALWKVTDPEELYEFCRDKGLTEVGVSSKWFCERMKAIMAMMGEGEKLMLPLETTCGLAVVADSALERVTSLQIKEAQFVCAVTNRRFICYTFGPMGSRERILPWDQVETAKGFQNGLLCSILIAAKDSENSTLLKNLSSTNYEYILAVIDAARKAE